MLKDKNIIYCMHLDFSTRGKNKGDLALFSLPVGAPPSSTKFIYLFISSRLTSVSHDPQQKNNISTLFNVYGTKSSPTHTNTSSLTIEFSIYTNPRIPMPVSKKFGSITQTNSQFPNQCPRTISLPSPTLVLEPCFQRYQ
jgi:hypothetical protein